jgi:hypothetical protein
MAKINSNINQYYTSYIDSLIQDSNGNAVVESDSKKAYAKKIYNGNQVKYYIMINGNSVFNPFNIYGQKKLSKSLFDKQDARFIGVNKNIFDMYLKFLNSQNLSLLYNVQREVLV